MKSAIIILLILPTIFLGKDYGWVVKHYNENEKENFLELECVNDTTCYAFSNYNTTNRLYKTMNQGRTWDIVYERNQLTEDTVWNMGDCVLIDSNHFYITYYDSNVIDFTDDGGKTINRTEIKSEKGRTWIQTLKMFDKNTGFVKIGQSIATTQDGWKTYKIFEDYEDYTFFDVGYFVDKQSIAIQKWRWNGGYGFWKIDINTGEKTELFDDGFPLDTSEQFTMYYSKFRLDESISYAVGFKDYKPSEQQLLVIDGIFKSKDGGKSWDLIYTSKDTIATGLQDIAFKDEMNGIVVGHNRWHITSDGGKSWERGWAPEEFGFGLANRIAYAGDVPIIANRKIYRYEEVNEDLEAMYFERLSFDSYCFNKDSVKLEDILVPKDTIKLGIQVYSGDGITLHIEDNDPFHKNTGFYFHPYLVGPGDHTVKIRASNKAMHKPKEIAKDSTFIFVVNESPEKPIITVIGNKLTTQYDEVAWFRKNKEFWVGTDKTHSPKREDIYYARVVDENGCIIFSDPYEFTYTSVADNNFNEIEIIGNQIRIKRNSLDNIKIYDLFGKEQKLEIRSNFIDISNLIRGVYFINYSIGGNYHSVKFIKN